MPDTKPKHTCSVHCAVTGSIEPIVTHCIACDLETVRIDCQTRQGCIAAGRIAAKIVELEAENAKLTDANAALVRLCGELR